MTEEKTLLKYPEILKKIDGKECHLLLGNGFNRGLGINTSYSAIFQKMLQNDLGIYKDAKDIVKKCGDDLEKFNKAKKLFPTSEIFLFDTKSITYELPDK